jgi:hypothetical protein
MKTQVFRGPSILSFLILTLALVLPADAARVKRAIQTDTIQVTSNTKIAVGATHSASLANLRVGDRVSIGYAEENGARVARRISDGVPHKTQNPSATPGANPQHHTGAPGVLHVHGVIRAIDLQAGTVTIAHK